MDFLKLIKSLDELLYEVMSWLIFYPITMWRMIRSPVRTMQSAETELSESERKQFDDTIPPPLFLLLTLILVHLAELGLYGQSYMAMRNFEANRFFSDDRSLTVFRILMISILPMAAAVRLAQARGLRIDRNSLKASFYSQCYAAALFLVWFVMAFAVAGRNFSIVEPGFLSVAALALLWLFVVEGFYFSSQLQGSLFQGFRQATILIGQWLIILTATIYLLQST